MGLICRGGCGRRRVVEDGMAFNEGKKKKERGIVICLLPSHYEDENHLLGLELSKIFRLH